MDQTDKLKSELRSYCAFLLKEYAIICPPTDPVIPFMYAIHKDMQLNNRKNEQIAFLITEASSKMKPQVFHFNSPGEAFKFQLGIAMKWISIGVLVLGVVWTAIWFWSARTNLGKAKKIIEYAKATDKLIPLVKMDEDGFYFIECVAAKKGLVKDLAEFTRIDRNTIRVYLGKDSTSTK